MGHGNLMSKLKSSVHSSSLVTSNVADSSPTSTISVEPAPLPEIDGHGKFISSPKSNAQPLISCCS